MASKEEIMKVKIKEENKVKLFKPNFFMRKKVNVNLNLTDQTII